MLPGNSIISIRPEYAEAILRLSKTVELRRRIPDTPKGTRLWIYATKPIAAIVGTAVVGDVARGAPQDIWSAYHLEVGVDEEQFYHYYRDAREAIAIELSQVQRCAPVSIQELRKLLAGFHPPQVMAKITQNDAENLEAWISAA